MSKLTRPWDGFAWKELATKRRCSECGASSTRMRESRSKRGHVWKVVCSLECQRDFEAKRFEDPPLSDREAVEACGPDAPYVPFTDGCL